ncbi:MAG TPA: PilW family protein [Casimicrobiaceae bacterium]|jgi:type IV pilus assembly protein PilW
MATLLVRSRQRGISLIELMVGVVIGLLAVLVIYQTFAVAEGVKRQTISAGDAQKTGMIATYLLGSELSSAGSGIMLNQDDLATCLDTGNVATTMRPFSVMITPGANAATADELVVNYSTARSVVTPSIFMAKTDAGGTQFTVQSPTGFKKGDMIATISGSGDCERHVVSAVTGPDANGNVVLDLDATVAAPIAKTPSFDVMPSMRLVNLGPANSTQRVRYDVVGGVLRSTDLVTAGATAQPLASSIMNLKALYGIDTDGNGTVDEWTPATGNYTPAKVLAAAGTELRRIKAVRLGMVVRSDEYDRDAPAYGWTLFECTTQEAVDYICPAKLTGTLGANYKYRVYETIIPLRNPMWNR